MRFAAATTAGRVRHENQDAVVIGRTLCAGGDRVEVQGDLTRSPGGPLVAVIDGMGGHRGGGEASTTVARYLLGRAVLHQHPDEHPSDQETNERAVHEMLTASDLLLHEKMRRRPELRAMGATVAGLACLPDATVVFNVGDARVYQYADGYLQRVSEDHRGASGHLLQSLGGTVERVTLAPCTRTIPSGGDDRWMLCSDGLWDFVPFPEIQGMLGEDDPAAVVAGLLTAALEAGSTDNVSIVVVGP